MYVGKTNFSKFKAAFCAFCVAMILSIGTPSGWTQKDQEAAPQFEDFEKIDLHSHIFVDVPELMDTLKRLNMRCVNICVFGTDREQLERMESGTEALYRKYGLYSCFASTFDLSRRNESNYVRQVTNWLDQSFKAGAVMTKIWKEIGMEIRNPAGEFIMPDDPLFDPIYDHLAKCGKPLITHLADPRAAWQPLDPKSVHYGYYSKNPEWHLYGRNDVPSYETIIAARDHIIEKHPDLIVIGAHLGSMAHDVDEVAKHLDKYPNFYVEVAARVADMSRQPKEKVRDFMIRYQDRIMYGTDFEVFWIDEGEYTEAEHLKFAGKAERMHRANYAFFAGKDSVQIAGQDVPGLELPRSVLEKFYRENAERLMPSLKQ